MSTSRAAHGLGVLQVSSAGVRKRIEATVYSQACKFSLSEFVFPALAPN